MESPAVSPPSAVQDVVDALADYPGLTAVAVVEVTGTDGRSLVAYAATDGVDVDVPALHDHVRKQLPYDRVPAAIVLLDELPTTAAGDVDLAALPAADLEGFAPYRAPGTPRQESLCAIWAEALGVPRVGVDDSLFELGGQSLEALLLAGRIGAVLGLEVSMADLFDAPTVAELDRLLDAADQR